jgi:ferric-dicitrate binding protein FerR (iron transport regulator)
MTHEDKNRTFDLDSAVETMRNDIPAQKQVQEAGARVWSRLQSVDIATDVEQIRGCADVRRLLPGFLAGQLSASRSLLVEDHLRECHDCREVAHSGSAHQVVWEMPRAARSRWGVPQFALAAAALVVLITGSLLMAWYFQSPDGMRARVQSANGTIYRVTPKGDQPIAVGTELAEGEFIRTAGGAHAFVKLLDGSLVEMSERSEFSVTARRKDTTVHLDQGRIIVQAAHRRTGHLYVLTPDAKVAVTGTVFAVNAGMKGSRVSVIEGEVYVDYNGTEDVLHSGDQTNTSANLSTVPVAEEIAWSADLDKHLALLAEFAKLQKKFEQIPTPGLRYSSAVLGKLPANTVLYASIPNLGDALNEANRIFQEQLQQSPVLRDWWNSGRQNSGPVTFEQMVQKLHGLSQYVGDEIVLAGFGGTMGGEHNAVFIAPIKSAGLKQFLQNEFTNLPTQQGTTVGLRVLGEDELMAAASTATHEMIAVVGEQYVMFSPSLATLRMVDAQLKSNAGGLSQTAFGQRLTGVYAQGVGLLFGVDLQQIIANSRTHVTDAKHQAALFSTGFSDADYLILEHRDLSGVPDNRAVLSFSGQRHGMASWLAVPNPTESLEFVSANAGAAVSFLTKNPALMLDDMMQMATSTSSTGQNHLAEANSKLNLDIRNDIAATLGSDVTLALDGPVLPKPSWKIILQVYDGERLQGSIEKLVVKINAEMAEHQKPGVELTSTDVKDRKFYTLRSLNPKALGTEVDYTYADGYLVAGSSRALVLNALRTKANGDSLARSGEFLGLLPKDGHVNFSAVMYQNLAPLLKPLAGQLSGPQMQVLQQMAADSKPTVICAYAGDDRIEVASGSRLLPFDLNSIGIATLLGRKHTGTSPAPQP